MSALFWLSSLLLVYTQAGYGALLALLGRLLPGRPAPPPAATPPSVTIVVAAYAEEDVIARRVENLRALDLPAEVIVACDGSPDATPQRAREAGADLVLELPRGGKVRAQDAGVRAAHGEIVAFSDANALWEPAALRALLAPFADPRVAYAAGRVAFVNSSHPPGTNQEGLYWRYDMALRARESALASLTAGNGAIYAVRRADYVEVDPVMGHDLSLPHVLVKRGKLAVDVADARATEKMVPSVEGEWARKRRMMDHTWAIVLHGGLLDPRGAGPLYGLFLVSHRLLRYATPFLHAAALVSALVLAPRRRLYAVAAAAQVALLGAAAAAVRWPRRPLLVARYYVLTTAAIAFGLLDHLRHGTRAGWEPAEGTR